MNTPFLIGKKSILRPVQLSDVPLFTKWMNDPDTRKYLLRRFPITELEEKNWTEKVGTLSGTPTNLVMVIETKKNHRPIGTMGLHSISWVDRNAVTGSLIGEKDYRGKGYAGDAKMALLQYAFETLGLHKIISKAFAKNTASIEYSKCCGYKVEAVHTEEIFSNGRWEDLVTLACFYEDWQKVSRKN